MQSLLVSMHGSWRDSPLALLSWFGVWVVSWVFVVVAVLCLFMFASFLKITFVVVGVKQKNSNKYVLSGIKNFSFVKGCYKLLSPFLQCTRID